MSFSPFHTWANGDLADEARTRGDETAVVRRDVLRRVPIWAIVAATILGVATLARFGIYGLGPAGLVLAAVGETLFRRWNGGQFRSSRSGRLFYIVGSILCILIWVGTALGWAN